MNSVEKIFQDIRYQIELVTNNYKLGIINIEEYTVLMREIRYRINKIDNALIDVQRELEKGKKDEVNSYS